MREFRLLGLLPGLFHCQCLLAQAQAPVPVAREHHHKVVLQNAYIRVLDGHVALNDTTPIHIHAANSVVVFLSHSRFGIQQAGGQPVITEVRSGDMRYSPYGDQPVTHIVWDQGPEDFHFYVVELARHAATTDTCTVLSRPGLSYQWRRGAVTAYYWDIPPDRPSALRAGDCAFFLIDPADSSYSFIPPNQDFDVKSHGRHILLQLQVR